MENKIYVLCMLIIVTYGEVYDICLSDGIHQCMSHQFCTRNITNISNVPSNANSLKLKLCSTSFFLQDILLISNNSMVTIEGHPTVIHCQKPNSGIRISQVSGLTLRDVTIRECGATFSNFNDNLHFSSSVYIENCSNIIVNSVTISGSKGSGILLINNKGIIRISNCKFENSSYRAKNIFVGVGLHIETCFCEDNIKQKCCELLCTNFRNSAYEITNCSFCNNDGIIDQDFDLSTAGWGRGGGLSIGVNNTDQIKIVLSRCTIAHNKAIWGGGLYLAIYKASGVEINIKFCDFMANQCPNNAGGGVNVGFVLPLSINNSILFYMCVFEDNVAYYGGGTSFFAHKNIEGTNKISFVKSVWRSNKAMFGAAADFSPQNLNTGVFSLEVIVTITDCNFINNNVISRRADVDSQNLKGKGTIWIERLLIFFSGNVQFFDNTGSALYALSGKIVFQQNSDIIFVNNTGFQGGAIALIGFSIMVYDDQSTFQFISNVAEDGGGAIFHVMYSQRDIHSSKTCFLQSVENNCKNTKFIFQNNSGGLKGRNKNESLQFGHSIYSTTLLPCYKSIKMYNKFATFEDVFSRISNFTFVNRNKYDLSTSEYIITINTTIIRSNPGKHFMLPLQVLDEFKNKIAAVFQVTIKNLDKSNISVDKDYTYISNNWIIFYGRPGDKANVILKTITIREKTVEFEVDMLDCPPGYVHNKTSRACICSADMKLYEGITSCNSIAFQSKLSRGYWAGYSNKYTKENSSLLLSVCPQLQCFADSLNATEYALPPTPSREELDDLICGGAHRTGILCSRCREGYAIHYHSGTNQCKQVMNKCRLGWLYYILSEIVPVTLIFLVITIFGIKLTSGSIGGFILFMQISVTMRIRNNGHIVFPEFTEQALNVYMSIASMFRLSFFNTDRLSFCLWASASNLDILAFKYITIFYALLLILGIIAVIKCCDIKITSKFSYSKVQQDYSSSIIHGISGFLVICYSECTRISLFLLTPAWLYSMSVENGAYWIKTVPFYDGTLDYFREKHLAYALPALFIFLSIGIVSPLLLLSYPLCYKILACLRLNESKVLKILCLVIPLEKCKPFFDSFQSCFRDECRYFSGLYFMYRLTTLIAFAFISEPLIFYIILETQFVLMLLAQVLFQPHRNKWHGISDALLFANLSVINLLTMLNQNLSYWSKKKYAIVISLIQVVLLYIPLIYFCFYLARKIVHRISCKKKKKKAADDYHQLSSLTTSLISAVEERNN